MVDNSNNKKSYRCDIYGKKCFIKVAYQAGNLRISSSPPADMHVFSEIMVSISFYFKFQLLNSSLIVFKVQKGVKRKADTTTSFGDDTPAKIATRRESGRPIKKPSHFIDYGQVRGLVLFVDYYSN
jgi:hypothetical protein